MQDRKLHKFIIITIIVPLEHDFVVRRDKSAIQILLQPFALKTHATDAPLGAASMSDANGACITSLSVKAAGWAPAACVMNRPAQAAAALQSRNFPEIMCLPL